MPSEAISGYYNRPWQWEKMKQNAKWVVQYGSTNDPFIPFAEMAEVAEKLGTELVQHSDRGHYMTSKFPDLLDHIVRKVNEENSN